MLRYILVFLSCVSVLISKAQVFTTQQSVGGVINNYASVSSINLSTYSFTVNNSAIFSACNKVLIIQMKGAQIDETESSSFGDIDAIGNAGNYEIRSIKSITGNVITFTDLTNSYDVSGKVQLVPVPEYQQGATITSTLTCSPWNGNTGGVLIFDATTLTMDGAIDVTGMGFRAGANNSDNIDKCSITEFTDSRNTMLYRSPSTNKTGAEKGEGVGESSFMFSIGKLGSGGGGGGLHNGSGGGGSNFGQGGTGALGSVNCPSSNPQGAKGQGASSLATYINSGKLFLGGGGGAGQGNNGGSSSSSPNANNDLNYGGAGGGIVIIKVDEIRTTWTGNNYPRNGGTISIIANGESAPNKVEAPQNTVYYDGAGGGGAGGSVLLDVGSINTTMANKSLEIEANGGRGGDTQSNQDCYAPGGGGGGGVVYFSSAATPVGISVVSILGGIKGDMHGGQENTASCQVNRENTNGSNGQIIYNLDLEASACCPTLGELTIDQSTLSVCENNTTDNLTTTFAVLTSGTSLSDYTITWYKDGTLISGQNGSTLSNAIVKSNGSGDYSVSIELNSSLGCTYESPDAAVSLLSVPTATIANGQPVCDGDNASLPITLGGVAPWDVTYTDFENTQKTITGIATSPYSLSVTDIGNYTLVEVSDDNCTTTATGVGTFTFHDVVDYTIDTQCKDDNSALADDQFQIIVKITDGDLNTIQVNETTSFGVSFSRVGSTDEWISNAIDEDHIISINVTDDNNCGGGEPTVNIERLCSCPDLGELTIDQSTLALCDDNLTSNLTTTFTAAGTGTSLTDYTITWYKDGSLISGQNGASLSNTEVRANGAGDYTVSIELNGCSNESSVSKASLVDDPVATIANGQSVCDGGNTNLPITLEGIAPWDVTFTDFENTQKTVSGITTSPYNLYVSDTGSYTLTAVSDSNCATTATGVGTFTFYDIVDYTIDTQCKEDNSILNEDQFQIIVKVTAGDLNTIDINETTSFGVSFSRIGSTDEWISNAIDEDHIISINVTDDNDCGGGKPANNIQRVCSCPTSGDIALTGNTSICEGATSTVEVSFEDGIGPFKVVLSGSESGEILFNTNASSPTSFMISKEEKYTAVIENSGDDCEVNALGEVELKFETEPTATLSGNEIICDDGLQTGSLDIKLEGEAPWSIVYSNGSASNTVTTSISNYNLESSEVATYSLESVSDATTCDGTVSGSGVISSLSPPISVINEGDVVLCPDDVMSLTINNETDVEYTWIINGSFQSIGETIQITPSSNIGTFEVLADNGICPVVTSLPVTISRVEIELEILEIPEYVLLDGEFEFTAITNADNVTWLDQLEDLSSLEERWSYKPLIGGYRIISVEAEKDNCKVDLDFEILVSQPLDIPNAFSPNGDGVNDFWEIVGLEKFTNARISVFNRWGAKIHEQYGPGNGIIWDGGNYPVGTYYYMIALGDELSSSAQGALTITK